MDLEQNKISFEGDSKTVLSGYRNLVEAIGKFSVNRIGNKPAEYIELYKRERVIEYINESLEEQNIVCAWEVKGRVIVICSLEESIVECTKIIDESVIEIQFPISKESSATLFSQEWQEEVKQIQDENDIAYKVISDKSSTNVSVLATDKEVSAIVCHIKTFLESQLEIKSDICKHESFSTKFQQMHNLDYRATQKMLNQIAEALSMYHVTINREVKGGCCVFNITGTLEGRELAKR